MSEMATWAIAEAETKFSELVDLARTVGPQTITRDGRETAVIVSIEDWERRVRQPGNLAAFFATSPRPDSQLDVTRDGTGRRPVAL